MGISEQTLRQAQGRLYYRRKKQYVGMGVEELRRLKVREVENRKLRQLVADLSLDKQLLQDVLRKKALNLLSKGTRTGIYRWPTG